MGDEITSRGTSGAVGVGKTITVPTGTYAKITLKLPGYVDYKFDSVTVGEITKFLTATLTPVALKCTTQTKGCKYGSDNEWTCTETGGWVEDPKQPCDEVNGGIFDWFIKNPLIALVGIGAVGLVLTSKGKKKPPV